MKNHVSILIVLMLVVHLNCSPKSPDQSLKQTPPQLENNPTLSLGMSHDSALRIIRDCGGQDITSELAVVRLNGEWPLSGLYWSLDQYDSVLQIAAENGNLVYLRYWTSADFSKSKDHRSKSGRSLKTLTFEKQTKTLKTQEL